MKNWKLELFFLNEMGPGFKCKGKKKMNATFNESGKNTGKCLLLKLIHQARCMRWRYGLDLGHMKQTKQREGKKNCSFVVERHNLQLMGAERVNKSPTKTPNSTTAVF